MATNGIRGQNAGAHDDYDAGARSYISNVLNELGVQFASHQEAMVRISHERTGDFFQMRSKLRQELLYEFIPKVHKMVYLLLTDGIKTDGTPYCTIPNGSKPLYGGDSVTRLIPGFSEKAANELAMSVSKSCMNLLIKEVLDVIISPNIFSDSLDRAAKKSALQGGQA